jgi:hypothetical protein
MYRAEAWFGLVVCPAVLFQPPLEVAESTYCGRSSLVADTVSIRLLLLLLFCGKVTVACPR